MSRYEVQITLETNEDTFAYGYDNPMQTYFWQVFDEEGEPLVDEGGFDKRSGGQLLEAMNKYGVEEIIDKTYPRHRQLAGLDLPLGDSSNDFQMA